MKRFIDDYIQTLRGGNKRRAAFLLEEAKVEKSELSTLADKISRSVSQANIVLSPEDTQGRTNGARVASNLRSADLAIKEMYRQSNLISLLLDSHASVLMSDVASLEKELDSLEKAVANYAFLLSDAKAYDYAFLESFSDSRGMDKSFEILPDRGGLTFRPSDYAQINGAEGTLSIGGKLSSNYPMTAKILATNVQGLVTSDTGIKNSVTTASNTGWRMAVRAPSPLNSTLNDFKGHHGKVSYPGALAVIEYTLAQPSPCDTITISPFTETPCEVIQVRVFKDSGETKYEDLLSEPMTLNSASSIFFTMQSVYKFKVYLRQGVYTRTSEKGISSEEEHREASNASDFDGHFYTSQRNGMIRATMLLNAINNSSTLAKMFKNSIPRTSFEKRHGGVSLQDLVTRLRKDRQSSFGVWTNNSRPAQIMSQLIRRNLFENNPEIMGTAPGLASAQLFDSVLKDLENLLNRVSGPNPLGSPVVPGSTYQTSYLKDEPGFDYEYDLGIRTIEIGSGAKGFKAVFVSNVIPAPGDVGEIKLKAQDSNYSILDTDRDSTRITSVEYSVTNKSNPMKETDWLPIMPVGTTEVIGERLLLDAQGKAVFRFEAGVNSPINIYKNGYVLTDVANILSLNSSRTAFESVNFTSIGYTSQDVFTVDYTPAVDHTVVNFYESGFRDVPLVSSFDESGAGEGFTGTNGQLIIPLDYTPYVDRDRVADSSYTVADGMTPYQPIIVRLEDGTIATNLTNYEGGSQAGVDSSAERYEYLHTGNSLIFNKEITQAFRVYYQYQPSNVRVRIVLRVNDKNFVSPQVDAFQIKAKTRKPDARYSF